MDKKNIKNRSYYNTFIPAQEITTLSLYKLNKRFTLTYFENSKNNMKYEKP